MPQQSENAVWCLSYFNAKQASREQLVYALLKLVEPTRAEKGCLQYELIVDDDNPDCLIMLEKFTSHEALEQHERQPYIKHFVDKEMDALCHKVSWHVGREITPT